MPQSDSVNCGDMKLVVGIGAGGHAKVIIDILRLTGEYDVRGLIDSNPESKGTTVSGVGVIGGDDQLPDLRNEGVRYVFMAVASLSDTRSNKRIFDQLCALGFEIINVVHPSAIVASTVRMGIGIRVFAGAIINPESHVGNNVVINTGAIVEHDCHIEDHAQIAPGAHLAGNVSVGEGSVVGMGANVIQGISIGRYAMIGAGAAVIKDVPDGITVVGVPAQPIRDNSAPRVSG